MHKESGEVLAIKQVPVDTDLQEIIKEISIMQQCDRYLHFDKIPLNVSHVYITTSLVVLNIIMISIILTILLVICKHYYF